MLTLPASAGTVNDSSVPTLYVPRCCTCSFGRALLTIGRWQDAGVHAPGGTQAFPMAGQTSQSGPLLEPAHPPARTLGGRIFTAPPLPRLEPRTPTPGVPS